jgi:hypothetical protein
MFSHYMKVYLIINIESTNVFNKTIFRVIIFERLKLMQKIHNQVTKKIFFFKYLLLNKLSCSVGYRFLYDKMSVCI